MKKSFALFLLSALIVSLFSACGDLESRTSDNTELSRQESREDGVLYSAKDSYGLSYNTNAADVSVRNPERVTADLGTSTKAVPDAYVTDTNGLYDSYTSGFWGEDAVVDTPFSTMSDEELLAVLTAEFDRALTRTPCFIEFGTMVTTIEGGNGGPCTYSGVLVRDKDGFYGSTNGNCLLHDGHEDVSDRMRRCVYIDGYFYDSAKETKTAMSYEEAERSFEDAFLDGVLNLPPSSEFGKITLTMRYSSGEIGVRLEEPSDLARDAVLHLFETSLGEVKEFDDLSVALTFDAEGILSNVWAAIPAVCEFEKGGSRWQFKAYTQAYINFLAFKDEQIVYTLPDDMKSYPEVG